MRARAWLFSIALFFGGCTLVLDAGRHQGGRSDGGDAGRTDGGACDRDGDGHEAMSCGGDDCDDTDATVYPDAPPICGNGQSEGCLGGTVDATFLGGVSAGILEPGELVSGGSHGIELAVAAHRQGGSGLGTGVMLVIDNPGVRRLDVPLNDTSTSSSVPLMDMMGVNLATQNIVSVSLSNVNADVITAMFTGVDIYWYTVFDLLAGDRLAFSSAQPGLFPPAIVDGFGRIYRDVPAGTPRIVFEISEVAAQFLPYTGVEVPTGRARTAVAGGFVMMQTADGQLTFWETASAPPTVMTLPGLTGMATFENRNGARWLVFARGGDVQFVDLDCFSGTCALPPTLPGTEVLVRTGAPSADAPDAATFPTGAAIGLIIEHQSGHEILSAQPIGVDGRIAAPRIRLLDIATGERIRDARISMMATPAGTTAFVGVLLAPSATADGTRILTTGLRACAAD